MTEAIEKINQETFEQLVPWYVSGQLSKVEAAQVQQFLQDNPEFEIQLKLIEEEREQAIIGNEALGSPSPRAFDRLMADIAAEKSVSSGWLQKLNSLLEPAMSWLGDMKPVAMAAAVLVIVVQMGAIGFMASKPGEKSGTSVKVASGPAKKVGMKTGTYVLIQFSDKASVADVKEFFEKNQGITSTGLTGNGLFKVRISDDKLDEAALAEVRERLKKSSSIVEFVFPAAHG